MRIVLDTNVLLSGFATHGICAGLLTLSFRDHVVVLSEYILAELSKHYVGKFKASSSQAATVAETLRHISEMVVPADVPADACEDAEDLPILGTAIAGSADCIVTGDKELLALGDYQDIAILSPRELYERLQSGDG